MIPVVDIFAGGGGLGEGFASYSDGAGSPYRVILSLEENEAAARTLELRAFYRQFQARHVPNDYYRLLRGEIGLAELFDAFQAEANTACGEVKRISLGADPSVADRIDDWMESALGGGDKWVLAGGPPCQAYSIAGRGRNRAVPGYVPENDTRHFLYREYLRIIAKHWPAVFVMENVPGILSSRIEGEPIFPRILEDLSDPAGLSRGEPAFGSRAHRYRLYSVVRKTDSDMFGVPQNPTADFVIESQRFGVPQNRHRVIVLGVRDDFESVPGILQEHSQLVGAARVLTGLPRLRSGLAREEDSGPKWLSSVKSVRNTRWYGTPANVGQERAAQELARVLRNLRLPARGRGGLFVRHRTDVGYRQDWYLDRRIGGVCNSGTRAHFEPDLHRYLFASCFAKVHRHSPTLSDFPEELMPEHRSVGNALSKGEFGDRFRVQLAAEPATTITSHIGRDGHYYIHYDTAQCRSLTVREAARIQTFPDNYFFFGNRGEQYSQVGNAVRPCWGCRLPESFMTCLPVQAPRTMVDTLTPERRSWNMSRIRGRDTKPEKLVRSLLHRMGYRYRICRRDLPGKPDIVLPRYRTVIFVHGCFWHRHENCRFAYNPKSKTKFWQRKFQRNVERDRSVKAELEQLGWRVLYVWECETGDPEYLSQVLDAQLMSVCAEDAICDKRSERET